MKFSSLYKNIFFLLLVSCSTKENTKPVIYEGPLRQIENMLMHYTEKEKVKMVLQAKKVNEFQNGDREFPEGIYLEFYNPSGIMTSTLRANTAYYFKQEDKWRGRGKVEVVNIEKHQQLNTEELFWKPDTKKIFTEKFVTITDQQDVIYGTGLDADQDLSNYSLGNTSGKLSVKE
ncbi:MAG: LPS export ABC transporter periplasmic protein LptC [Bacteroidetes bacterium]|nr:LPS export ABC transporter periplasmic protein LptC [Bacteroidota bacterium]